MKNILQSLLFAASLLLATIASATDEIVVIGHKYPELSWSDVVELKRTMDAASYSGLIGPSYEFTGGGGGGNISVLCDIGSSIGQDLCQPSDFDLSDEEKASSEAFDNKAVELIEKAHQLTPDEQEAAKALLLEINRNLNTIDFLTENNLNPDSRLDLLQSQYDSLAVILDY